MLAKDHGVKVNVNEEMDNVEVRWMFRPDPLGSATATMEASPGAFREVRGDHFYAVIVRSQKFQHSKLIGEIKPEDVTNIVRVRSHVGILAGALAEEVNERFGDNLNPEEVARAAIEAFLEMVSDQKRALLQSTH